MTVEAADTIELLLLNDSGQGWHAVFAQQHGRHVATATCCDNWLTPSGVSLRVFYVAKYEDAIYVIHAFAGRTPV